MANIGCRRKSGGKFQGEIVTPSVQTKNVRIVPETDRADDNDPSHRVCAVRAEIGAASSKRSTEGRDHLAARLDDPSFNALPERHVRRRRPSVSWIVFPPHKFDFGCFAGCHAPGKVEIPKARFASETK
jgi:uncharacterized protein (DUF736 family)